MTTRARRSFLITCEHGGNRIPARYRALFVGRRARLESHRGYDPGALRMARALATALRAPLVTSTTTRLRVDLNRSHLRRRLPPRAYVGIELEMNRRIILAAGRRWKVLPDALIDAFRTAQSGGPQ